MKRIIGLGIGVLVASAVILNSDASFAAKKEPEAKNTSQRYCHKQALKKYPDYTTAAHKAAMARCMAGGKA